MVSFWPFRSGEDAASFEKTLSTLTGKISRAAARNDTLRQRSKRVRVMWTLYAGFAYILVAILLIFVTGWHNWGPVEGSVVAVGPVLIYLVRTSLTTYYDYRISNTELYLKNLNKARDTAIERLKEATKYNSTQQLLEKYSSSPKGKPSGSPTPQKQSQGPQKQAAAPGSRTTMAPPPTANIQRPPQQQLKPQRSTSALSSPQDSSLALALPSTEDLEAEFAPNAFEKPGLTRQYSTSATSTSTQTHWYDRILDALLGEDETQPKNRLALICSDCRLVNGQAPPGVRTIEDIGRWRCGGCGAWNGKEKVQDDVVAGLVENWEAERKARDEEGLDTGESEDDGGRLAAMDESSGMDIASKETPPPSKSTRSKSKGKSKK
ncbi:hypothetical protein BDV95DRAFT_594164 [Massariosphaeria phaeospora]|uniref:Endoplasmic reticulum junction formation protein lunapark n=1 Tax=Massariosphaeria phaeospora TaxID=100035 RepID=A0A7C8I6B0_9PLEO|nr:hypothetical protein BDV95DRAFT_594164 [Massariosphaeria phaeospora]